MPSRHPRRGRLWLNDGSCVRLQAERPNHVWSYDFVHHLQGLIEQILEISTNEARDWKPSDVEIDLASLLRSVQPILEFSLAAAGMALQVKVADGLPQLRADDRAVRRLLTNLMDSAAKYSGLGLGLWLVNLLMSAHGGTAHFEKTPSGHDLTVSLEFPPEQTV